MSVSASSLLPSLVPIGRIVVASAIVAAASLLPARAVAQSTCSIVCMKLGDLYADSLCASRIAVDSTITAYAGITTYTTHAAFNIKTGTITLETSARRALPTSQVFTRFASLSWTDEFQIVGLPSGPPITFQARLNTTGFVRNDDPPFGVGNTEIGLRDAASNSALQVFPGDSLEKTIVLMITASPGQPFLLTVSAFSFAQTGISQASTRTVGVLVFGDLPAGAKVTSCGGYLNDTPVPVRRSTWGALKLRYR